MYKRQGEYVGIDTLRELMGIGTRLDHLHPLQVDRILRQLFHERFAHRVMAVALPVQDAAHLRFTGIQGMGEEGLRHTFRMRSGIAAVSYTHLSMAPHSSAIRIRGRRISNRIKRGCSPISCGASRARASVDAGSG